MDKETYTFEDRVYVNPETSLNEQLGFVDKLRSLQQEGTDKITRDTHNLGTDVTPNLGGLTGAEGMWQQQYVTPRVNTMLSNLRATAQAQALNDVLGNYQNQMKKRYNDAYSAARRRAGGGGGDDGNKGGGDKEGEVDWKATNKSGVKVGRSGFAGSAKPDQSAKKNYDVLTHLGKKQGSISVEFDKDGNVVYLNNGAVTFTGPKAQAQWNSNYSKRKLVER